MEFDFERQAMRGDPLPKKLDVADTCAYMALVHLYAMHRAGFIDREAAKREKETIVHNWTMDKSRLEFLNRESETLRQRIDKASAEYVEKPSVETGDRLYAAFWDLPEDWRNRNESS